MSIDTLAIFDSSRVPSLVVKKQGERSTVKRFDDKNRMRQYWRNVMQSVHCKLSEGAYQIARIIPYGHKDCWRRPDLNKARHEHAKKK
jgi:hypothetical protein